MILTVVRAAQLLDLAPSTVRRMAHAGEIPAVRIGRGWRFDEFLLRSWVRRRSVEDLKPCLADVEKAPRIGRSGFSSLDAKLESLLAQPTETQPNSSKKS